MVLSARNTLGVRWDTRAHIIQDIPSNENPPGRQEGKDGQGSVKDEA
jgi:hypothetical protein